MFYLMSLVIFSENLIFSKKNEVTSLKKHENKKSNMPKKKLKTLFPNMRCFFLDNGLEVVFIPNAISPLVSIGILYRYGSADDEPKVYGIAHFLEHMMFKGTQSYPKGQLHNIILGMGGAHNAFTDWDYTFYHVSAPRYALERLLELEADRMVNLVIHDKEVATEKMVVQEEESMSLNNNLGFGEAYKIGLKILFTEHPYGVRAIGNPHHIQAYNRENTNAAYKKWYAPNNAVLIISGNFEINQIQAVVEKKFGALKLSPKIPKQRIRQKEPKFEGIIRYITYENQKSTMVIAQIIYANKCLRESSPVEIMAYHIATFMLGGNAISLLYKEFVRNKQLVTDVFSYNMVRLDPMFVVVQFKLRPHLNFKNAFEHFNRFMRNLSEQGMFQPWFEKRFEEAKQQIKAKIIFAVDGTTCVPWFFKDCGIGYNPEQINSVLETVDKVSLDNVRNIIKNINNKPIGILMMHPPGYKLDLFK